MKQQNTRKQTVYRKTKATKHQPKVTKRKKAIPETGINVPAFRPIDARIVYFIIMAFSFLIYSNAIFNDFTLDDGIVITKNSFTKRGIAGIPDILSYDTMAGEHGKNVDFVAGGRYRPLSVVTFAIEYQLFGENARVFHTTNILLYGFTGILIYMILFKLLIGSAYRPLIPRWYFSVPFVTAMLFIAHPIHTEIVANIKGRDEIMTMLGALGALWFTLKYLDNYDKKYLLFSFLCFFGGLMSKENAVTFLSVIPVAVFLFTDKPARKNFISLIPLVLATFLFVLIRYKTVGFASQGTAHELMNNSFVDADKSQRYGTVFYTFYMYFRLLLFPHPLTWDYYPYYIPLVKFFDPRSILPMLLYAFIGITGFLSLLKRKHKIYTWSVVIYFSTLSVVSNLLFSIGVFMSERFMYLSSLGYCLLLTYALVRLLPEYLSEKKNFDKNLINKGLLAFFSIVLVLFSIKTFTRNFDWKDNYTLFTHDVKISSTSAKGNTTAGEQLVIKGMAAKTPEEAEPYYKLAVEYLERSLQIHPRYVAARLDLGIAYEKYKKEYQKAVDMYISTIALKPNYDKAYNNISVLFRNLDSVDFQIKTYERLYRLNPNRSDVNNVLGSLYGARKGDLKKAVFYLEKAVEIDENNVDALADLGVAYGMSKNYNKAIKVFERAYKLKPDYVLVLKNLSASYRQLGDMEKAKFYAKKMIETQQRLEAKRKQMNQQRGRQ